jgi:hypothetical protein
MKIYLLLISIIILCLSCQMDKAKEQTSKTASDRVQGAAKEVLQTSNYTYILMNVEGKEIWIACSKMDANIGNKYYFKENTKMVNFQSKELNRVFDTILFVQEISTEPSFFNQQSQGQTEHKTDLKITKQNVKIRIPKGITSIADLYLNKNKYQGTVITVKGVVTKYNPEIMSKNWIHIQDGTEQDGHFDLTITTMEKTKLGDTLTFAGKVNLDKDFGYGYKYEVLLEDAVIK